MRSPLQRWLSQALRGLPYAAADRLRADYQAHVQGSLDEGLSESEAVMALGDPEKVHEELSAAYLSRNELAELRFAPNFIEWIYWGILGLAIWQTASLLLTPSRLGLRLCWITLVIVMTLVLLLSRRQRPKMRRLLREVTGMGLSVVMMGLQTVTDWLDGEALT